MKKRKLGMRCRLANLRKGWINETKQIMELLSIKDEDLLGNKYSNYKTQYKNNLICRACGQQEETQKHILEECHNLHPTPGTKVTTSDIFHQDYIIQK